LTGIFYNNYGGITLSNRLELVQDFVNGLVAAIAKDKKPYFFAHLYGVASCSALLAVKRGLNPELASVAGMLHDINVVKTGSYDDHGAEGAKIAGAFLSGAALFSQAEITLITDAITRHCEKQTLHQPFDEVIKDADFLQPYLSNITIPPSPPLGIPKIEALFRELGLVWDIA
jgi:uncharacterized protein